MKNFLYLSLILILVLTFVSCNKDTSTTPTNFRGEVQFSINQLGFDNFKNGEDTVPECSDLPWSYAKFTLSGIDYTTQLITMVDGNVNTSPIQLDTGNYVLSSMYIWYNNGTPEDESDDILVRAAPLTGSKYYKLLDNTVDMTIHVEGFKKLGYTVDVLCFEELYYEEFGFIWFNLNNVVIHQICIFGDVCTNDPSLYTGSLYEQQENGLQMDMPAIFQASIYKNGELQSTFSNEEWFGEGNCLPVHWADVTNDDEEFYLVIKTLLPVGTGFDYVTVDSIYFTDEGSELTLDDGVLVFEVGNCHEQSQDDPGYGCTAWINLPTDPFTFTLTGVGSIYNAPYTPASLGTYFDYSFSEVPTGYAVHDGDWAGWCGDKFTIIGTNIPYQATFISSVTPLPAGFYLTQEQVNELNWIFNHTEDYFFPGFTGDWTNLEPEAWRQIQFAVWGITNGLDLSGDPNTATAATIKADAIANGYDFYPLPDQYGIVFVYFNGELQLQIVLLYC